MKYIITALALSLLAGGTFNLNAQTNTNSVPDVVEAIIAKPQISNADARVVQQYYAAQGGQAGWIAAARTIADKSPYAAAIVKFADKDSAGWTPEMVRAQTGPAAWLALMPSASDEFRDFVWGIVTDPTNPISAARGAQLMKFFKQRRSALPVQEQIALTQQQKELLLAMPARNNSANAWLAEMSADLIALSLDQKQ
jgi:hypothetical protein